MRHLSILLGLFLLGTSTTMAQWDDIYYNPNKKEKNKIEKTDNLTTGRTDITVDQYNMRGFGVTSALAIDTIGAQVASEPDFVYTGQIQKYYNPTIVVDNADVLADVINNSYGNVNVIINNGRPVIDVYDYNWPYYYWPSYPNVSGWCLPTWPLYWTRNYGYNWCGPYSWAYSPFNPYNSYNPYWWMWSGTYIDYFSPSHPRHFTYGMHNPYGNNTYKVHKTLRGNNANRYNMSSANYRPNRNINDAMVTSGSGRPNTSGFRTNSNVNRNETQGTLSGGYRNNSNTNTGVNRNGYHGLNNSWGNSSGSNNTNTRMRGNTNTGTTYNNGGSRSYGGGSTMRSSGANSGMGGGATRGNMNAGGSRAGGGGGIRR